MLRRPRSPIPSNVPKPIYGDPQATSKMKDLRERMQKMLQSQRATDYFARWQSYLAERLQQSAASATGSELNGTGRLSSYGHMLRDPLSAPAEAELFTRLLHKAIVDDPSGLGPAVATASQSLDLGKRTVRAFAEVSSPEQALDVVKKALAEARFAHARALAALSKAEIATLVSELYPVLVSQNQAGHTLNDNARGRVLVNLMEKMDRQALIEAAEAIVPLSDPKLLDQLRQFPADGKVAVDGVIGRVAAKIDTPAGTILIGGKESKTYKLDEMKDVAVVIDLGHGNTYEEGTTSLDRPVLIVLNLGGGNIFRGKKPGIQGEAMLGVSLVVNREGNNSYQADDLAQASAIAGVGIIVEHGGKNTYRGVRRVQGQALGGVGILIGRGGENDYHAAMWAQGFGAPLGFGLLEDTVGHDHYYCGGLYVTSYKHPTNSRIPATPGYEGFGQGVGAGIRRWVTAASASFSTGAAITFMNLIISPTAEVTGAAWDSPATLAATASGLSHERPGTAALVPSRSFSALAAAGDVIMRRASCSTTAATAFMKARSWGPAWAGIVPSAPLELR